MNTPTWRFAKKKTLSKQPSIFRKCGARVLIATKHHYEEVSSVFTCARHEDSQRRVKSIPQQETRFTRSPRCSHSLAASRSGLLLVPFYLTLRKLAITLEGLARFASGRATHSVYTTSTHCYETSMRGAKHFTSRSTHHAEQVHARGVPSMSRGRDCS